MKRGWMPVLVIAIAAICQASQAAELTDLISGEMFPLTMQLKDLDEGWRSMNVAAQPDIADPLQFYTSMFGGGSRPFYTKGQTVAVGRETFVVGYRARTPAFDFLQMMGMDMGGEPPESEELSPESEVALSLVNLRAIASLDDIRPFDLEKEIAESKRLAELMRETPWAGTCDVSSSSSNLRQAMLALIMYAQDHDEALPPMDDAAALIEALSDYVVRADVFIQPDTAEPYRPNANLSGKKLEDIESPEDAVVFYEASAAEDGSRWVAFLDTSVRRVEEEEWERLKEASGIE